MCTKKSCDKDAVDVQAGKYTKDLAICVEGTTKVCCSGPRAGIA